MIARLQKSMQEKDKGFTLIELLVVMIIIGILAAIAIPVFLSQREKANDTATRGDISTLGKEIASYYVDNTATPVLTPGDPVVFGPTGDTININMSDGTSLTSQAADLVNRDNWCVSAVNTAGTGNGFMYTAANGLTSGPAAANTCP